MVARVAQDAGVRALAIKGPIAAHYGLRTSNDCARDVDVIVAPGGVSRLISRLLTLGWEVVEPTEGAMIVPLHSLALRHVMWPCELDIHHAFPGFLNNAAQVFESLWAGRSRVDLAACTIAAPGKPGVYLIEALHDLRDPSFHRSRRRLLESRIEQLGDPAGLVGLAVSTGSLATAWPVLGRFAGPELEPDWVALRGQKQYQRWFLRVRSKNVPMVSAIYGVMASEMSMRDRIDHLRKVLFLNEREVMAKAPDLVNKPLALPRAHVRRWGRGFKALPWAYRTLRAAVRENG